MEDTEKTELLNTFFISVFTAKTVPKESQTLEVKESLEKGRLHFGEGESVQRPSKKTICTQIHGP